MSKRAWYRCNERKALALLIQGKKIRFENGVYYYKRRVAKKNGVKAQNAEEIK